MLRFVYGCLLAMALPLWAACPMPLRVVVEDWPPYSFFDSAGKPSGLDIELIAAVAAKAGCKVQYLRDIPRKRRHLMFQQGDLDLLFAASITQERRAYSWFTRPYREELVTIFSLSDRPPPPIASIEDLRHQSGTLLAPNTGWYGERYAAIAEELKQGDRWWGYEDYEQGLKMLMARRADYLMGDHYALLYQAREKMGQQLRQLGAPVNRNPVHLMLSRRSIHQSLVQSIDQAIEDLEQSGLLARIRSRYGQ